MALSIGTVKRRLESTLEDFQRARKAWHELGTDGFSAANALVNAVIQSRYADQSAYWHPALTREFPDIVRDYQEKMQHIVNQHQEKVQAFVQKMARQLAKMKLQVQELHALCRRLTDQHGENYVQTVPLYKTCPIQVYDKRLEEIVQMYSEAMETLSSLAGSKGFVKIKSREEGLALLSVWMNNPNIDEITINEFLSICETEIYSKA